MHMVIKAFEGKAFKAYNKVNDLLVWMAFSRLGHGSLFIAYQSTREQAMCSGGYLFQNYGYNTEWPRAVCVLSANGAISSVTLREAATSGGTATYEMCKSVLSYHYHINYFIFPFKSFLECWFDILSLSGSFILSEMDGQKSRTDGLSIALSGPGGSVADLLVAASPAQVSFFCSLKIGSFLPEGSKANYMEPSSAPQKMSLGGGAAGTSILPSRWTLSESSGGHGSPLNLALVVAITSTTASQACNGNNGCQNYCLLLTAYPPCKLVCSLKSRVRSISIGKKVILSKVSRSTKAEDAVYVWR
ncbi:hypothetical protein BUALT_Bualt08G0005200 [Buddleja alternifolia]|uniref:AT-hook motif nuclear-localized protein n=1 Tax=Buddleja alternifolia TaxID=168488 RepID=A0AAV6XDF9_9LAMI|nr:hypothetical protein BUALT_Bualt08G0005200 [Buddleja alternifolia]